MTRVALVGAGSVEFTHSLLADLLALPELGAVTVALHDIDQERLATAERLARRLAGQAGSGLRVEAFLDRRAALAGADYVVNEIQVGGYRATLADFEIPKRYGIRQTIGDTIGIGGIFRGLRTIPVAVGIGADMAAECPDALLLNYANPMAMVPWAVYEASGFDRVVGVCHSVRDTHAFLASLVGVPEAEIDFLTAGFNHQAFVLRFERAGEDLYPRLDTAIERAPELGRRVRMELYRRFGRFPTESSEHSAEYVPWFMGFDDQLMEFRIPVDEYLRRSKENLDSYAATRRALDRGEPLDLEPGHELATNIIHSIETGTPRTEYGNVRNDGLIDNLPGGCCVEVPCRVDAHGVRPIPVGALPAQLAALNRTFLNVAELTVRAALDQRRELVYQAAMLDPNTGGHLRLTDIRAMCDELITAHGELLPEGIRRG